MTKHSLIRWLIVVALVVGVVGGMARVETMQERRDRITGRRDDSDRTFSQMRIALRDDVRSSGGSQADVMLGSSRDFQGGQQPAKPVNENDIKMLRNEIKLLEQKVAALEADVEFDIAGWLHTLGTESGATTPMYLKQGQGGTLFWGSGLPGWGGKHEYMVLQLQSTGGGELIPVWDWVRAHGSW